LTKQPRDVDRPGQAGGEALPPSVAEGFMSPAGLTHDDLRAAATLIDDWDWDNFHWTGEEDGNDHCPHSSVELVAKIYERLAAAIARNQESSKTGTIQN
jgi:hypothetical protein